MENRYEKFIGNNNKIALDTRLTYEHKEILYGCNALLFAWETLIALGNDKLTELIDDMGELEEIHLGVMYFDFELDIDEVIHWCEALSKK